MIEEDISYDIQWSELKANVWEGGPAHLKLGGNEGTGSKPYVRRREMPTKAWNARLNLRLATLGDPNVMQRMSAYGYSMAAQAAPAKHSITIVN